MMVSLSDHFFMGSLIHILPYFPYRIESIAKKEGVRGLKPSWGCLFP